MATFDLVRSAPGRIVRSGLIQTSSTSRRSPSTWLTLSLEQYIFDSKFRVTILQQDGQWHGRGIIASSSRRLPRQCRSYAKMLPAKLHITSSRNPSALLLFATDGTIWNTLDTFPQKLRGEAMPMTLHYRFRHRCSNSLSRYKTSNMFPNRKPIKLLHMLKSIFQQAIRAGIRHPHGDPRLRVPQSLDVPGLLT